MPDDKHSKSQFLEDLRGNSPTLAYWIRHFFGRHNVCFFNCDFLISGAAASIWMELENSISNQSQTGGE
jgi:hypothetical protein